jgi:hypothetical protein
MKISRAKKLLYVAVIIAVFAMIIIAAEFGDTGAASGPLQHTVAPTVPAPSRIQ